MELELSGKRALVTASSAGIGYAIAENLAAEGVKVCLNARNEENLRRACSKAGGNTFVAGDLNAVGEGTRIATAAMEQLGGIDILVVNCGGPAKADFMQTQDEQWHGDFQSLVMSSVEMLRSVLPSMCEQRYGRIVLITSIAAREPLPGLTTSSVLRAGLGGLAKSVANEYASSGITINVVLPGYTNTDRIKALNLSPQQVAQMVPAGRLGEPQELAALVTFLASARAGYITGQSIAVDGGVLRGY